MSRRWGDTPYACPSTRHVRTPRTCVHVLRCSTRATGGTGAGRPPVRRSVMGHRSAVVLAVAGATLLSGCAGTEWLLGSTNLDTPGGRCVAVEEEHGRAPVTPVEPLRTSEMRDATVPPAVVGPSCSGRSRGARAPSRGRPTSTPSSTSRCGSTSSAATGGGSWWPSRVRCSPPEAVCRPEGPAPRRWKVSR